MAGQIMHANGVDGSFKRDPLVTASAATAMRKLEIQAAKSLRLGGHSEADKSRFRGAYQRSLAGLAVMQGENGLFLCAHDQTIEDRALVAAFVTWQFVNDDDFRAAVRLSDLMNWFEIHRHELEPGTLRLWRLARSGAAEHIPAA